MSHENNTRAVASEAAPTTCLDSIKKKRLTCVISFGISIELLFFLIYEHAYNHNIIILFKHVKKRVHCKFNSTFVV